MLDAINLVNDSNVLRILYNPIGRTTLIQATQIIGSDVLNITPYNLTGFGKTVSVIDTGIDSSHPDLQGNISSTQRCICNLSKSCCTFGPNNATDEQGHGTLVSGIISSPAGVAPSANILPIRVTNSGGFALSSDVLEALELIALNPSWGVDAVNISLAFPGGGPYPSIECSSSSPWNLFAPVVSNLNSQGVTVIAGSGNDSDPNSEGAPACLSSVVSVGATWTRSGDIIPGFQGCTAGSVTIEDEMSCYSTYSDNTDLMAPGGYTTTTAMGGGYITTLGTSLAAPMTAGCVALLKQDNASYTTQEILEAVTNATWHRVPSHSPSQNSTIYPRLDCLAAVNWARHDRSDVEAFAIELPNQTVQIGARVNGERSTTNLDLSWSVGSSSVYNGGNFIGPLNPNCNASAATIG